MNPRPLGYEPNELPDCSTPRQISISNLKSQFRDLKLVGLGRVELPTSRLSGVRSNQLSYRPKILFREPAHSHITCEFCRKKEPHFSSVRSVSTVDAPEGRVASVAINCLRSTSLLIIKELIPISDLKFEIKKELISEN